MAAGDARPFPLKNAAYRVYFPILDADGDLVTGATGLDSERSLDGAAFADCTNEATEIATSSGVYYLDLTSSEMNADCVVVIVKTSSSGAKTTVLTLYPQEADDIRVSVTHFGGTAGTFASGRPEVNASHISGSSAAADAVEANIGNLDDAITDVMSRLGAPAGASLAADIAAIEAQTDDIGVAGAGLTAIPWNSAWDAEVQSEVQDALEANHLDHLLAVTYDPASKPGAADALLNELVENDAGVARFSANALEQAPAGEGGGSGPTAAEIADAVWDELRADHTTSGSFGEGAASVQGNVTGSIGSLAAQAKADVNAEADTALADYDPPTKAELDAGLGALNDLDATEVQTAAAAALTAYDPPTNAELVSEINSVQADIAALNDITAADVWAEATRTITGTEAGALTSASFGAGAVNNTVVDATAAAEIADALLGRNIAGGSDGGRTVTSALRRLRNKVEISGGTLTVYQENDSSSAWTASVTTTAGDPISSIDPS